LKIVYISIKKYKKETMPDYSKGKIYCIKNVIDDDKYYGSTIEPLAVRWRKHKTARNMENFKHRPIYKKMNELGIENFFIELVEEYSCNNKLELFAREKHWVKEYGTLNQNIPSRTKKEYNLDNKEKLSEQSRQYKIEHKEQIAERRKLYYETHKEQRKQYLENNKDHIKQRTQLYEQKNKDHIKERKQLYEQNNKDKINERKQMKITCECGCIVSRGHMSEHKKRNKHKLLMDFK
jgi:hypothetical protein